MTITLNGTTGINTPGVVNTAAQTVATTLAVTGITTIAAGSAAAPALVGATGGATTGVWFPAASTVAFANAGVESARIDSNGIFIVGGTNQSNGAKVLSIFNGSTQNGFVSYDSAGASGTTFFMCSTNGTNIGTIARVGATSAVNYNTTSDQRLKSNIKDAAPVLDKLMTVKVRQYDWTEGELHQDYGFVAQEIEPLLSGVVTKGKTEEDVWQLDYSKLTPHLVKAIQEQQALIISLTARITALENR